MFLTPPQIFEATRGGLDVILSYLPQAAESVDNPTKKFKIRDSEKTASAGLKEIAGGVWLVTDFGGDQVPRNCIVLVMLFENLSFKDSIALIAQRWNIVPPEQQREVIKPERSKRPATEEEPEGDLQTAVRDHWTEYELGVMFAPKVIEFVKGFKKDGWKAHLEEILHSPPLNFYPLISYTKIKDREAKTTASTDKYPIILVQGDEGFKKIIQPLAKKEFRFQYHGAKPKDHLFGYRALIKKHGDIQTPYDPEKMEEKPPEKKIPHCILCSGERDAANVKALGYEVVWKNSETAKLDITTANRIKELCENFYNLPDIDTTGIREGHNLAMFYLEMKTIWLPEELRLHNDERGNPCKDVRDYLKHWGKSAFDDLVETALPYQFWSERPVFDKKGVWYKDEYYFKNTRAYNFLQRNGFFRFRLDNEKEGYTFVRVEKNVVQKLKATEVRDFINSFLEKRRFPEDLKDMFFKTNQLNEGSLSNLKEINIDFTDYDRVSQHMFFMNGSWEITKEGVKAHLPGDIARYVWETEVIKHRVKLLDPPFRITSTKRPDGSTAYDIEILRKDDIFLNYLINASRVHWRKEYEEGWTPAQEAERLAYMEEHKFNIAGPRLTEEEKHEQIMHLINKIYALGYLIHRYKDPSRPWCVYAMDAKPSEDGLSHGRSGKSIAFKSPRYLMNSVTLPGRNPRLTDNPHIYDQVSEHTDYILIDDADPFLKFNFFFDALTGELTVNPKNNKQFLIPFEHVPKFCITTNYTLRNVDSSTEGRILYTVFGDYYHVNSSGEYREDRSPKDEFGKNLFSDYTEDEWNLFFNTMAQCCAAYLNYDKIAPPMKNVFLRNLITQMGEAFKGWADVYFSTGSSTLDQLVEKSEAFRDYVNKTGAKNWTSQGFGKALKAWCSFYGYQLNPVELQNSQKRITRQMPDRDKNGVIYDAFKKVSTEMIYIRTSIHKVMPELKKTEGKVEVTQGESDFPY